MIDGKGGWSERPQARADVVVAWGSRPRAPSAHSRRPIAVGGRQPQLLSLQTTDFDTEPVVELSSEAASSKIVPYPEGTRSYDDLRRAVPCEPIGSGLRPSIASPADLARMLSALGREQDSQAERDAMRD